MTALHAAPAASGLPVLALLEGDALVLGGVLAVTAAFALWWRARQGRVTDVAPDAKAFGRASLGAPEGTTLLVEFTAPGCVPCAQTKSILTSAAQAHDGVTVVVADVGDHLDLARAHRVLRAPTTLVVDAQDRVRHRISGVPTPGDVEALIDDAVRT